jgi:hypothetical protein
MEAVQEIEDQRHYDHYDNESNHSRIREIVDNAAAGFTLGVLDDDRLNYVCRVLTLIGSSLQADK